MRLRRFESEERFEDARPDGINFSLQIVEILVQPGDVVKIDDPLITLETDKASMDVPAPSAGPVRTIHVPKVDAFNMGALMMHFMLETILMGRLMGVDPFNQPGVEEGKILARQYLGQSA